MAALRACDEFIFFSNGIKAAVVQFRCPEVVSYLDIPSLRSPDEKSVPVDDPNNCGTKKDASQIDNGDAGTKNADAQRAVSQNWILACRISPDGQLVAVCDDSKHLHMFEVCQDGCRLISSRCVTRRVTRVQFTKDSQHVVVVDRSGDAYRFPVLEQPVVGAGDRDRCAKARPTSEAVDSEEAAPGGTLLLGHLSMVLDVLLVADDSLIVTCDRDEKIRVSRYPDAYQIESYCLGHTQFVVTLAYDEERKLLISGSGDASVRVWTLDGKEVTRVNILDNLPTDDNVDTDQTVSPDDQCQEADRLAVQSLVYCAKCQLLFVSVNRSRHVLVYRLIASGSSASLQLCSVLSGPGTVSNVAVSGCVLWLARKEEGKLRLSAHTVKDVGDTVQIDDVGAGSTEHRILQTLNSCADLGDAPPTAFDLFPLLWKSGFQEDFKDHWRTKRATGDPKSQKDTKKQKVEAAAS